MIIDDMPNERTRTAIERARAAIDREIEPHDEVAYCTPATESEPSALMQRRSGMSDRQIAVMAIEQRASLLSETHSMINQALEVAADAIGGELGDIQRETDEKVAVQIADLRIEITALNDEVKRLRDMLGDDGDVTALGGRTNAT